MPRNQLPPPPPSTLDKVAADFNTQKHENTATQKNHYTIAQETRKPEPQSHSNSKALEGRTSTYKLPPHSFAKIAAMVADARIQFPSRQITDSQIVAIAIDRLFDTFERAGYSTFSEFEFKPKPGPKNKEEIPQPADFQDFE